MIRTKLVLVTLASVLCLAAGWLGIASYITHQIGQSNRGWCDFIQAAQPRNAAEQPTPGGYGDRLLQALDRRGSDIGCLSGPPRH